MCYNTCVSVCVILAVLFGECLCCSASLLLHLLSVHSFLHSQWIISRWNIENLVKPHNIPQKYIQYLLSFNQNQNYNRPLVSYTKAVM